MKSTLTGLWEQIWPISLGKIGVEKASEGGVFQNVKTKFMERKKVRNLLLSNEFVILLVVWLSFCHFVPDQCWFSVSHIIFFYIMQYTSSLKLIRELMLYVFLIMIFILTHLLCFKFNLVYVQKMYVSERKV